AVWAKVFSMLEKVCTKTSDKASRRTDGLERWVMLVLPYVVSAVQEWSTEEGVVEVRFFPYGMVCGHIDSRAAQNAVRVPKKSRRRGGNDRD
ncbi:hypothetical protein OAS39_11655, partial [Pirellulales bacterium]|nr:hypothetical protein [Pirellulales bacterium]